MTVNELPSSLRERVPLIKPEWIELFRFMGEHPHAPRWNTRCGDRLRQDDLDFVKGYALGLESRPASGENPPDSIIDWCSGMCLRSDFFRQRLSGISLNRDWHRVVPMTRDDMQSGLELIVPRDADLSRLVINPTSGTTGHPIPAPNHPSGVGCYDPLIQYALRMNGLTSPCAGPRVAAIQVCSQKKTITYHTVHSYMDGAGFAKLNLEPSDWRSRQSPALYINEMKPVFLSGDPYSFLDYIDSGIGYRPDAVLSTAVAMEQAVRHKLEEYFRCPVVDMYSLNETGPVAYSCPRYPDRHHVLPHDLFVEIIDGNGIPLPAGEHGMIAVTGGRNPYLPLLRYITGDSASMQYGKCSCGETSPALLNLNGRKMVIFSQRDGSAVNSIDISGVVRSFPVYFFRFKQKADYSCELSLCAGNSLTSASIKMMHGRISELFGSGIEIRIDSGLDPAEKSVPFTCEVGI